VSKHVYEINVQGAVSPGLLAELGATPFPPSPLETVITTSRLSPDQLQRIVARIADLGLDVLELRRLPCAVTPATA
jgi:hypothetical protein